MQCQALESQVIALDEQLKILEGVKIELKTDLSDIQSMTMQNRKQLNLRKHYDSEVRRWLEEMKADNEEVRSIIEIIQAELATRFALEERITLALVESDKSASTFERHSHPSDLSMTSLASRVVNEPAEAWTEDEVEYKSASQDRQKHQLEQASRSSMYRSLTYVSFLFCLVAILISVYSGGKHNQIWDEDFQFSTRKIPLHNASQKSRYKRPQ